MIEGRPCKFCSHELDEHEDYYDNPYFFCPGQDNCPPEVMNFYIPMTNLEYLESLYNKKISKEVTSK